MTVSGNAVLTSKAAGFTVLGAKPKKFTTWAAAEATAKLLKSIGVKASAIKPMFSGPYFVEVLAA